MLCYSKNKTTIDEWTKAASHLLEVDAQQLNLFDQACSFNFTSPPGRLFSHYRFLSLSHYPQHDGFTYSILNSLPSFNRTNNATISQSSQRDICQRIASMFKHKHNVGNQYCYAINTNLCAWIECCKLLM